jgi:hypothetical protein
MSCTNEAGIDPGSFYEIVKLSREPVVAATRTIGQSGKNEGEWIVRGTLAL